MAGSEGSSANQQGLAVAEAVAAWAKAPAHIRAMAGAYVGPLLAALQALEARVNDIEQVAYELGEKYL